MDDLTVTEALFELADPGDPWAVRVFAIGKGFVSRGTRPFAAVGDVVVERLVTAPDSMGFSGTLAVEPRDGARLRVGWSPDELVDTDVVYQASGNV